ncbi:MAG: O-antigen ligase family protein [bacterium]
MKNLRKVLMIALFATAFTPAIYAENTLTPSQNAKTLFFRGCIALVSVLFSVLMIKSASFRSEVKERLVVVWKHPLVKITTLLYGILCVSTIFAYHHLLGFFGEAERDEGFLGLTFFYSLFLYTILLFQKKDWYVYFGTAIATQLFVFSSAIHQFANGTHRTNSIVGNPIYFATYALCLLCISFAIYFQAKKEEWYTVKIISIISIIVAILEIFLSNTRALMLGVAIAVPVVLSLLFVYSDTVFSSAKKVYAKRIIVVIFAAFVVFGAIFLSTRQAKIWTHIPGLDRIAQSSTTDSSTVSRLVSWNIALHSINPVEAGIGRTLFGYGWDNYFFAWQKFYQTALFEYDTATFDRPHNKLLDMLVMNGVLGFLAYMLFWFLFIKILVRYAKKEPLFSILFVSWAVAYFVQNLFAFDNIITWILFFAIVAFVTNETLDAQKEVIVKKQ